MIELAIETNVPRLTPGAQFDELSNYLGRYIKIEGLPTNSHGNSGDNTLFSRAGKLIGVTDYTPARKPKDEGYDPKKTTYKSGGPGVIVEGLQKVDLNFESKNLRILIFQADVGTWEVIHEPNV